MDKELFGEFKQRVMKALVEAGFNSEERLSALAMMGDNLPRYERMFVICQAYASKGLTLEEIGDTMNITRERVRQILQDAIRVGVLRRREMMGARSIRTLERRAAEKERRDKLYAIRVARYFDGLSVEEFLKLNKGERNFWKSGGGPNRARIYFHQRRAALRFGYEWKMTFVEWCSVWDQSGLWPLRGRGGAFYALARKDSTKPFEMGNVAIRMGRAISSDAAKRGWREHPRDSGPGMTLIAKQDKALELRESGKSMREIGAKLGIAQNTASGYCTGARRRRELKAKGLSVNPRGLAIPEQDESESAL